MCGKSSAFKNAEEVYCYYYSDKGSMYIKKADASYSYSKLRR